MKTSLLIGVAALQLALAATYSEPTPAPPSYSRDYDRSGYDQYGYDQGGYSRDGYDNKGYNRDGYNRDGYDQDGYNYDGYDQDGYDNDGYDHDGYDYKGYNRDGYNRDGYAAKKDYKHKKPSSYKRTAAPPTAPPSRGVTEFKQFWNTVDYCDAELALTECLVQCNVIQDFATSARVANCIKQFTSTLCKKVPTDGCDTGRVSVTSQNCTSDAVIAAMYTIGEIQKVTIGDDKAPVNLYKADNPDSFTAIKLAVTMQGLVNYGNCIGGSLLNYASTCDAKKYFGGKTNKCVSNILKTCKGKDTEEPIIGKGLSLGDILTTTVFPPNSSDEYVDSHERGHVQHAALLSSEYGRLPSRGDDRKFIYDHHTSDPREVDKLATLIQNASAVTYRTVPVEIKRHQHKVNEAKLSVCPNAYVPLNYRIPFDTLTPGMYSSKGGIPAVAANYDLPGFPINDTAFHFPAQTYNSVKKKWEPAVYTNSTANQFPKGTPLDPITPRGGIRDTCEKFHFLSMLAWFAGEDTGDYCFTIDGYTAEFLENNEVQPLSWDEIAVAATCSNNQDLQAQIDAITAKATALNVLNASQVDILGPSTDLALDQSVYLATVVKKPGCATCYNITWKDASYCPRHIARFGMQLRCCRSFAHTMKARVKKNPALSPVPCGTYSPNWDGACTTSDQLEFTHTVYSEVGKGELQETTSSYYTNVDGVADKIFDLFAIFQGALLNLTTAQQKLLLEALNYFNWNNDCTKGIKCYDRGTRLTWTRKNYTGDDSIWKHDRPQHCYLQGNSWANSANSLINVDIDWGTLIGLEPADGKCFAPTCLLSRYVSCAEQNSTTPVKYSYNVPHAQHYGYRTSKYNRIMLETGDYHIGVYGVAGFIAGIAVIAIAQVVLRTKQEIDRETPYHQQLIAKASGKRMNATDAAAAHVHGVNPQHLVEKILRNRIYDCMYWKEQCFGLTEESLVEKAVELTYVAGHFGGNQQPSPFLCLLLKMLQMQPDIEVVKTFIENADYKYVTALGAMYLRLTGKPVDIYLTLEGLLADYRKLRFRKTIGWEIIHMDQLADMLLREEYFCNIALPRLMERYQLENLKLLPPRKSAMDEALLSDSDEEMINQRN
ncbi:pre-mRNA-splicing factor 38A [Thraustotheca clavata]|uniref:Pre-mRNA-splicing factor 38A n=1 Tax=Thraustotheca clavata TaxID=74557 RepID=A0A1W0AAM9_9STRA|nr:pre-mRNA-splicing factor 38A [Thraustotheca clavata]